MNSNSRNHRGGGPRPHASIARQEWVPRGQPNAPPPLNDPNAPPPPLDQPHAPRHPLNQPIAHLPSLNTPSSHGYDSTVDCRNSNGNAANRRHRGKSLNQQGINGIDDCVPVHRVNHGPRGYAGRYTSNRRAKEKESSEADERKDLKNLNLPQLVQEIQEKLMKGTVECMICYDMVRRSAPIWSCSSCYSIFHMNCIKKWARAPTSVDLSADRNNGNNWRCPGCQHVQLTSSKEIRYLCFCRKRTDPPSDLYLTPHSCGESCGKPLESDVATGTEGKEKEEYLCPHACVLQCHPGPCPPCKAFAPPRICPCGKKTITTRCSDRKPVLTCGQRCSKLLECGRHRCMQTCHVGSCQPCKDLFNASCFCKKKVEVIPCGEMSVKGEVDMNNGVFSCGSICGNKLGCENHACSEICHPGPCEECNLLPGKIDTCHCGKTTLLEERKSCLDPVPTCSEVCGKSLLCRIHQCKETCHVGDCPLCVIPVTQKCRCGLTSRTTECYKSREENFTCDKPCGRKKNCGRHRCSEKCCPLSTNINTLTNSEWDPHFCTMPCGKRLRCGQHYCQTLCHSGHCPPCLETIFNDLCCACGNTSLPPPLPCGTPPPSCQLPCSSPQSCGHPSSHSCHFGECPPCSVPVAKECVGGHVVLRNIPCGSKDIRCNKLCGKTRCCGLHACGKTCHPPPCDASNINTSNQRSSCMQICGAPRRECRHTCRALCHPSSPCPDVKCDYLVTITCSCGRITASVPCDSGGANSNFASDSVFEASIIQKLPAPLQPVDSKIPLGQRKLVCDSECAKLDRKRVLADAFNVAPPNLEALHLGENPAVSDLVNDLLRRDPKWAISVEERCKFLVLGKNRLNSTNLKVHVFCPMIKEKRDAVRLIADRWKLAISSAGWEPRRFVVIHATPKSKTPSRVLGVKGSITTGHHPPAFDPLVDMDPRLVVSFLELPREADINALVLRFGGECELVWLNDKNALAVFSDPARAATALRRLDHGSVYHGAVVVVQEGGSSSGSNNVWGGATASSRGNNPWKKAVVIEEANWNEENLWSSSTVPSASTDAAPSGREPPILPSSNRWSVLNGGASQSSGMEAGNANFAGEVVDDWEKAYE